MRGRSGARRTAGAGWISAGRRAAAALLCFLGGGVLNLVWSGFLNRLSLQRWFSNETQEALLSGALPVQIIGLGFLVPAAEELIFRGLVYPRMKERLSVRQAVFFSALLFALYHGNPLQMIFSFPMALVLALLFEQSGTVLFPVLFHMGVNLAAVFF